MSIDQITAAEYRQWQHEQMTEAQLQDEVVRIARSHGWLVYHTYDSRRSAPGFPDLVLVHPSRAGAPIILAELKRQKGRIQREQLEWLTALELRTEDAATMVALWRPSDLEHITTLLTGGTDGI